MKFLFVLVALLLGTLLDARPGCSRSSAEVENLRRELSNEIAIEEKLQNEQLTVNDMILTHKQKVIFGIESENEEDVLQDNGEEKRKLVDVVGGVNFWPDGRVPWAMDPADPLNKLTMDNIRKSLTILEAETCLRFSEVTLPYKGDHILFNKRNRCSSAVGRIGGAQNVSIGTNCEKIGIIIHEVGHAVGMFHEQMRSDRDDFITVNFNNIHFSVAENFFKVKSNNLIPFDHNSIMMYGAYQGSSNGQPTIVPLDKDLFVLLGNLQELSYYDKMTLNTAYQCSRHCSNTCVGGGFLNKNCKCVCPKGLGGPRCETFDSSNFCCGKLVRLQPGENHTFSTDNYPSDYVKPANCAWVFTAPEGCYLQMQFESLELASWGGACLDRVEVRYNLPGQRGIDYCRKPDRIFSTHKRKENIMSVFLNSVYSSSKGFRATVQAIRPSACAASPCFNGATCVDNGDPHRFVCKCASGTSGALCKIVTTATLRIDFENGLSPMTQLANDDLDWTLMNGPTPTYGTGPDDAQDGKFYLYVESSFNFNKVAGVSTPQIVASRPKILSFYYHMRGSRMGTLRLIQHFVDGKEKTVWSRFGHQGYKWNYANFTLNAEPVNYYLHFVAVTDRFTSDIALDNIVVETVMPVDKPDNKATSTKPGLKEFTADFETSLAPFVNKADRAWVVRSGPTPTLGTGPRSAHTGKQYAYFETTGPHTGETAIIQTPLLDNTEDKCLQFYYHMYGAHMGTLEVKINGVTPLLSKSGNQGDQWSKANISIPPQKQPYTIGFVATKGNSCTGDIAIDGVTFGTCR